MSSLVTLDIESFYDREFSLSKISTEEYVRDNRFEVIGFGQAVLLIVVRLKVNCD